MVRIKYGIILLLFLSASCEPENKDGFAIYYMHSTVQTPKSETDFLLYRTDTSGNSEIALFNNDTIYSETGVRFDFSGEWMTYSDPFSYGVILKRVDNNEKKEIKVNRGSFSPVLSPYGDCIAFISRDEKDNLLLTVVLLNIEDTLILPPEFDSYTQCEYPSFSPDGNKVVYSKVRTDEYKKIYILDLKTEESKEVINAEGHATYPSFSPDGIFILYMAQINGDNYQICRYRMNSDVIELLTTEGDNRYPLYSPDGNYIVFSSKRDGDEDFEIYMMKADGTELKKLTDNDHDDIYPVVYEEVSLSANNPPLAPYNPEPDNGEENVDRVLTLKWESEDPDGDVVFYDLYFGEDEDNLQLINRNMRDNKEGVSGLKANTYYFWKITAKDIHGAESEGAVWKFKTGE